MSTLIGTFNSAVDAENAANSLSQEGLHNVVLSRVPSDRSDRWTVSVRPPFGMGRCVIDIMEQFHVSGFSDHAGRGLAGDTDRISKLSGHVAVGLISQLSARKSPGAISALSGHRSPGSIAKLSAHKSPAAISRASRHFSPGVIATLSAGGSSASLPSNWLLSRSLGIPLLTRSQGPVEPEGTLLTTDR